MTKVTASGNLLVLAISALGLIFALDIIVSAFPEGAGRGAGTWIFFVGALVMTAASAAVFVMSPRAPAQADVAVDRAVTGAPATSLWVAVSA